MPTPTPARRSRPAALRAATVVALALLAAPAGARAQVTRAWTLCFTSHVASCDDFFLTTTPILDPSSTRVGTFLDVLVRHTQHGGVVSGLQDFAFYFTPAGTGADDPPQPVTPQPVSGAPLVAAGAELRWQEFGRSDPASPADPTLDFAAFTNPTFDQFLGGCLGGAFDATFQSPLATCGAQAYRLALPSATRFDADLVTALAVDVYAGDADGDGLPDQATCNAPTDGGPGTGFDLGDMASGDVCRATAAVLATPEPAPAALLALSLGMLTAAARRRRPR